MPPGCGRIRTEWPQSSGADVAHRRACGKHVAPGARFLATSPASSDAHSARARLKALSRRAGRWPYSSGTAAPLGLSSESWRAVCHRQRVLAGRTSAGPAADRQIAPIARQRPLTSGPTASTATSPLPTGGRTALRLAIQVGNISVLEPEASLPTLGQSASNSDRRC
jgi:hypothetical protein